MGRFVPPSASSVNSIQSGFVGLNNTGVIVGTIGQDGRYVDITISAVDISKCTVSVQGGFGDSQAEASRAASGNSSVDTYQTLARLTSSTNLRVSCYQSSASADSAHFQWQVVEYS